MGRHGDPYRVTAREDAMDKERMMPVHANQAMMWTLSTDRKMVRLAVPTLRLAG